MQSSIYSIAILSLGISNLTTRKTCSSCIDSYLFPWGSMLLTQDLPTIRDEQLLRHRTGGGLLDFLRASGAYCGSVYNLGGVDLGLGFEFDMLLRMTR